MAGEALKKICAKNNTYRSKIKIPTLYCLRQADSCLHCKFRNGAWRPRAAFQDSEFPNEDRIIDIDVGMDNVACSTHIATHSLIIL